MSACARRTWLGVLPLLLAGCWSVVPGYGPSGRGIAQGERDRDEDATLLIYTWDEVPDPRPVGWNPLVMLGNGLVSLAMLPVEAVGLALFGWLLLGDDDDEDEERRLPPDEEEALGRARERGERDERRRHEECQRDLEGRRP